ncbi:adenylate/guanylate cyclase domain-containing protein [Gordonia sinesedis]
MTTHPDSGESARSAADDAADRRPTGDADEPRYTRDELVEELDISPEYAEKMWNAFGFARLSTDEKIFTDDELEAFRLLAGAEHTMPDTAQIATARAIGQTMSRLTEWQADQLRELDRDPDVPWTIPQMAAALSTVQRLVWRRHLAQALARDTEQIDDVQMDLVVGFADIVGYTSLSRRIGLTQLEQLLEAFEDRTHDVVLRRGGQVVKTLGDAVMYTFSDTAAAADTALAIHELSEHDPIPALRVGMARGEVLSRLGDVFGQPVNVASRLCGSARPGSVLVDEAVAAELADNDRFYLKSIPPLNVRGYRHLKAKTLEANKYYDARTGD